MTSEVGLPGLLGAAVDVRAACGCGSWVVAAAAAAFGLCAEGFCTRPVYVLEVLSVLLLFSLPGSMAPSMRLPQHGGIHCWRVRARVSRTALVCVLMRGFSLAPSPGS